MLAIHWTPVNKTKHILKNGITKSKNGLYCFPMTGDKVLDKWWINFFNNCNVRPRKKYNGIIFRITKQDLPAYFGHWIGTTKRDDFEKPIKTIKELDFRFRDCLLYRLGEMIRIKGVDDILAAYNDSDKFVEIAENAIKNNKDLSSFMLNDLSLKTFTFEDYQIVLSNSINPDRIIKIIPQGDEFGKHIRRRKKEKMR
jgi:hypothetical protein